MGRMAELWIGQRGEGEGSGRERWWNEDIMTLGTRVDGPNGVTLHRARPEEWKAVLHLCTMKRNALCCHGKLIGINKQIHK